MKTAVFLLLASLVVTTGCVDVNPAPNEANHVVEPTLCDEAVAHMAECSGLEDVFGGEPALFTDVCDEELATNILNLDCATVRDASKSDVAGAFLCNAGLLRYCEVPACETALPADFEEWGECEELIYAEGCASCDYYRCREASSVAMCGEDGYFLDFGYRYCLRFKQVTEPRMSDEGMIWSARTRRCLMEVLETAIDDTLVCEDVKTEAYDSHPACYSESGFCELPASDWWKVISTVDFADTDVALGMEIGADCISE